MNRLDIQYALKKRGHTQAGVARELGVTKSVITEVISGNKTSRRVAEHLSGLIGKPVTQVFGSRYADSAQRTSSTADTHK